MIQAKVMDATTNKTIPFVSVGIKGTNIGTLSDDNGSFKINIEKAAENDSLKISAIGYKSKTYSAANVRSFFEELVFLQPENYILKEVMILPTKTTTKVLGNKRYNKQGYCTFNSKAKGTQVAIKIENEKKRSLFVEDFNFCLNINAFSDSIIFRLNFFDADENGLPGKSLLKKQVIFSPNPSIGISKLDLKNESIFIDEKVFFVSLECISDLTKNQKTGYSPAEIGFSGSPKGPVYVNAASQGKWQQKPIAGVDFNITVSYQK
ncbi:MAG: carboxypeptidase-like regulatory domain-containing protein [Burkholderiales bacterium]|nr:carboxypeptidase-like regulatory domain-containing protein [Bacteroidia bacterium]